MSWTEDAEAPETGAASRLAQGLPFLICLCGLILSVVLWHALASAEARDRTQVLSIEARAIEAMVEAGLRERARVLERTAERWRLTGGRTREAFELEAAVNRQSYPSILTLGWVGSDSVVRWISPETGRRSLIGFDNSSSPPRAAALSRARTDGFGATPMVDLIPTGSGLIMFQRIGRAGDTDDDQGFISAALDVQEFLRRTLGNAAPRYPLQILVGDRVAYERADDDGRAPSDQFMSHTAAFSFSGTAWKIRLWAPPLPPLRLTTLAPLLGAALSLLLASALAIGRLMQVRMRMLRRSVDAEERRARVVSEEFHMLADNISQLAWIADRTGWIYWYNKRWFDYTGTDLNNMRGWGWRAVHHPEHVERVTIKFADAIQRGISWEDTFPLRSRDGEYRWFLSRAVPIRDAAGAVTHWFGTNTDITEQRTDQARLRNSESRLRAVVETAVDAIVVIDVRGVIQSINPAVEKLFGYAAEDCIGRNVSMLMGGTDRRDHDAYLARYLATGERRIIGIGREVEGRRKDGSTFLVDLAIAEWRDDAGERFFTGIMRDVTERRAAMDRLREAHDLLQSVIDGATDPIFVKDRAGTFVFANCRTAEIFGVEPASLPGRRDADYLPPHVVAAIETADRQVIAGGKRITLEEVIPEHGREHIYHTVKVPWRRDGEVIGVIGVARDITDRKHAEQEILSLNRDLEARVLERTQRLADVNAELQAFAYSVSHDLRAPLRAMEGFSQALIEDYADTLDTTARNYLDRILNGAKQLDTLIQDLLAYSRLAREEIETISLPLDAVIGSALRQQSRIISERQADVRVEHPLPHVIGHEAILVQVFTNLISNALKFVAPGTHPIVRIWAQDQGHCWRVWVEDNGIGIAAEHQQRIFEVFHRLHGLRDYPGTGIGLAIVRKGAARLGGAAGIESEPGHGSRFWVDLPKAPAKKPAEGDAHGRTKAYSIG